MQSSALELNQIVYLEQVQADVPLGRVWMTEREVTRLSSMRFPKRREDWTLGRWTAKRALVTVLGLSCDESRMADFELESLPSGAPRVLYRSRPLPISISLSHRGGFALCSLSLAGIGIGCDIEKVEPRSSAFVGDYFTPKEQRLLDGSELSCRFRLITLLWSTKESALKLLQTGLTADTRSVEVVITQGLTPVQERGDSVGWQYLHVRCRNRQLLYGWFQCAEDWVRTFVADSPHPPPRNLLIAARNQIVRQDIFACGAETTDKEYTDAVQ